MPHRRLTAQQTADYLHISMQDLDHLVRKRKIPFEKVGERIMFQKIAIEQWANQRLLETNHGDGHLRDSINVRARDNHFADETNPQLIPTLLTPTRIEPELGARTKSSVLSEMTMLAEETGLVNNPVDLLESLRDREELCSTAMADGIALLHPRHHHEYLFEESFIVLGRAIQPIPFGAPDGRLTDIFFLICCGDDRQHLRTLARLAAMCSKTTLIADLRAAGDAVQMFDLIETAELQVLMPAR